MIREIRHETELVALVVPHDHTTQGIEFYTPNEFSQQVALICHPAGHEIPPHVHKPVPREVQLTREVLFVRRGRILVDLYTQDRRFLETIELGPGDVILLASGGHGFRVLEPVDMVEVKQGPYAGSEDKERFVATRDGSVGATDPLAVRPPRPPDRPR